MDTGFELPAFVRDAERQTGPAGGEWPLTAAERGTAAHGVLASLPAVSLTAEQVRAHCDGLVRAGALTERQAEAVPAGSISEITQSALWARMGASARCERELPFSYLVPAAALYGADAADEKVLLQGVIDCCFVTGDGWVLLDYKTVLFGTVDPAVSKVFFENVDHVLAGRKLDYLVIHHMSRTTPARSARCCCAIRRPSSSAATASAPCCSSSAAA